eukprot:5347783-Prymnesium_polylepis.1
MGRQAGGRRQRVAPFSALSGSTTVRLGASESAWSTPSSSPSNGPDTPRPPAHTHVKPLATRSHVKPLAARTARLAARTV